MQTESRAESDWTKAPLRELIAHIVATHHTHERSEMERLGKLVTKIASVHGTKHAELRALDLVFREFTNDLSGHMMKEERILFPAIERIEAQGRAAGPLPFGAIANPVHMMNADHKTAERFLGDIRRLTHDFTAPADASDETVRELYEGLAALEKDLQTHMHVESDFLFPRAIECDEKRR